MVTATVDGGVARVVLNHPPLNILTREAMASLRREVTRLAGDPALRVLLLAAEGKHFSAGADVGEHLPPEFREMIPEFLETVSALEAVPFPVVAAVHGRCLGGAFELVQVADIVVAARGASFGQPEIHLGVFPPAACVVLPARCGPGGAAEILYAGDPISADDALRAGLVQRVVDDGSLADAAEELVSRIARHSAAALRLTKRAVRESLDMGRAAALRHAGRIYVEELMATRDAEEGLRAFVDKRTPAWSHQ